VDCRSNAIDDSHRLRERKRFGASVSRASPFLNEFEYSGMGHFGQEGFWGGLQAFLLHSFR
jgi:hypothetical protein